MDYHRRHTLFQAVEAAAEQDPDAGGAVGVHEAGVILPLYD